MAITVTFKGGALDGDVIEHNAIWHPGEQIQVNIQRPWGPGRQLYQFATVDEDGNLVFEFAEEIMDPPLDCGDPDCEHCG